MAKCTLSSRRFQFGDFIITKEILEANADLRVFLTSHGVSFKITKNGLVQLEGDNINNLPFHELMENLPVAYAELAPVQAQAQAQAQPIIINDAVAVSPPYTSQRLMSSAAPLRSAPPPVPPVPEVSAEDAVRAEELKAEGNALFREAQHKSNKEAAALYKQAIHKYDAAIAIRRNFSAAFLNRGVCLEKLSYLSNTSDEEKKSYQTQAVSAFSTAIMFKPDYEKAKQGRARVLKEVRQSRINHEASSSEAARLEPNRAQQGFVSAAAPAQPSSSGLGRLTALARQWVGRNPRDTQGSPDTGNSSNAGNSRNA